MRRGSDGGGGALLPSKFFELTLSLCSVEGFHPRYRGRSIARGKPRPINIEYVHLPLSGNVSVEFATTTTIGVNVCGVKGDIVAHFSFETT